MVFVKLFEFTDSDDRRRHDHYAKIAGLWASAWLLYLYASSSTSSPPPPSLLRILRLLRQLRATMASPSSFSVATVVENSSAGPLHSATWLYALPRMSGIDKIGVCLRPRRAARSGKPGTRLGLRGLMASSSLRPRRITVFVYSTSVQTLFDAPLAPAASYATTSASATGYPMHGILNHGYSP